MLDLSGGKIYKSTSALVCSVVWDSHAHWRDLITFKDVIPKTILLYSIALISLVSPPMFCISISKEFSLWSWFKHLSSPVYLVTNKRKIGGLKMMGQKACLNVCKKKLIYSIEVTLSIHLQLLNFSHCIQPVNF